MNPLEFCFAALLGALPIQVEAPTAAEQYNLEARQVLTQCSRVEIEYEFVADRAGPDHLQVARIGLTPRQASILADAIGVAHMVRKPPGIGGDFSSIAFTFYNGKEQVALVGSDLSRDAGSIVLLPWKQPHADYTLTPESAKALRDWVLKQPRLAKFPH